MKRTFAHPWAIVRRSTLNCVADTDEANVRLALGDRSFPRQATVDECSSPSHTRILTCGRTFAQQWTIVRPQGNHLSRDLFRSPNPLHPSLSLTPLHLPHAVHSPTTPNSPTYHKAPTKSPQLTTNRGKPPLTTTIGH
jgi:hypothetical protein